MIANDLREMLKQDPFTPFRVVLTGGGHYDIRDPELVVVMKSQLFIALPDGERWVLVPFLHIASVEANLNGRGGKPSRRKRRS